MNYKGKWLVDYFIKQFPTFIKYKLGISNKPIDLMLVITQNCNSKCIMCDYWKNNEKNELSVDELKKLLSSDIMSDLKNITLTGGEILLRQDIGDIIKAVYDTKGIKPNLGTNGMLYMVLDRLLETHKQYIGGVSLSFDGIGEVSNKVRGDKTFELAMKSVEVLKKHGIKPGGNMTLTRFNYDKLIETYEFFKDKVAFTYKPVHSTPYHFGNNSELDLSLTEEMKKKIVEDGNKIGVDNLYDAFLDDWLLKGERPLPCYAGTANLVIDSNGNLQPCIHKPILGNIRGQSIDKIWNSEKMNDFRKNTAPTCKECYHRCTTHSYGLESPKWVIKYRWKKFKTKMKNYFSEKENKKINKMENKAPAIMIENELNPINKING